MLRKADSDTKAWAEAGRVSAASILPCRMGKLREKIFSELSPHRKIACDQRVEHEIRQESKAWQGTGREAREPSDRRLASPAHCQHTNSLIDNSSWFCYLVRNLAVGNRATVSPAPRGMNRMAGAPALAGAASN